MAKTVVVIGNGIAALSAVEKIREQDQESRIMIFAQERFHTYNRLELSKRIMTEYPAEQIFVKPAEWYDAHNIELRLGASIVRLDLKKKTVTTAQGEQVGFTHLLLANGGSNFVPPIPGIDLANVFSLRSLEDARKIQKSAATAKELLLIGGGLLGLEMAWQFQQAGLAITIVEMFPQLMPRQLDLESARYLEKVITNYGVELILEGQVAQLVGTEAVTGYQLKGEEQVRSVDLCIYSTGMRSNIGLFKESGLEIHHGVVVDQYMRTNVTDVYAAGDISEYNGRVYGLWSAARTQGAVAGENIAAGLTVGGASFEATNPVTNINVFNQVITSLGEVQPEGAVVLREQNQDKPILKKLFFKEERLCGAIFINNQKEVLLVRKAVEHGVEVPLGRRTSFAEVISYLHSLA